MLWWPIPMSIVAALADATYEMAKAVASRSFERTMSKSSCLRLNLLSAWIRSRKRRANFLGQLVPGITYCLKYIFSDQGGAGDFAMRYDCPVLGRTCTRIADR